MEDYMDDYESYKRFKRLCKCLCDAHCGFACQTDGCLCEDCECPKCADDQDK